MGGGIGMGNTCKPMAVLFQCMTKFTTNKKKRYNIKKQIGKGVRQGCILSLCLFNLYAEYIMRNAGLEESQARIKIAGRNINSLRYSDDITLMAESEEELKSILMKVKEESEKVGLKLNIQITKTMASGTITSWQIDGRNSGNSGRFYFLRLENHCRWWLQP